MNPPAFKLDPDQFWPWLLLAAVGHLLLLAVPWPERRVVASREEPVIVSLEDVGVLSPEQPQPDLSGPAEGDPAGAIVPSVGSPVPVVPDRRLEPRVGSTKPIPERQESSLAAVREAAGDSSRPEASDGAVSKVVSPGPQLFPSGALLPGVASPLGLQPGDLSGTRPAGNGPLYLPGKVIPVAEVKARIEREARDLLARDRAARGLTSPEVLGMGSRLESVWRLNPEDVRRFPVRAKTQTEHWVPPGLESDAGALASPCTYQRYSLAEVVIELDRFGTLRTCMIVRSSGSREWDRLARDLVDAAQPFPAPRAEDLNAEGISRTRWEIAARDYSLSSCRFFGASTLIKDIVLLGAG